MNRNTQHPQYLYGYVCSDFILRQMSLRELYKVINVLCTHALFSPSAMSLHPFHPTNDPCYYHDPALALHGSECL